jgi:hypothetical protein
MGKAWPFINAAVLVVMALFFHVASVQAAGKLSVALAANGTWLDGPETPFPKTVELGATAATSLSPHISLVGSGLTSPGEAYVRYAAGARVTATDVNDPNFDVFLGLQYRGGSTAEVGPSEWSYLAQMPAMGFKVTA